MKEKKQIILLIVFSLLLTSWGFIQTDIKSTPQIVLIICGSITFFTSLLKNKILFSILFYPLFTLLSYLTLFMISIANNEFNNAKQRINRNWWDNAWYQLWPLNISWNYYKSNNFNRNINIVSVKMEKGCKYWKILCYRF